MIKQSDQGEESSWWRNRTGRSLSLLQIHRKNNRTVNKVYETTSDRQQRTSGAQKSSPLSWKGGRIKILKIKKGTQENEGRRPVLRRESRPGKGVSIEEVSNHQETLVLAGLREVFLPSQLHDQVQSYHRSQQIQHMIFFSFLKSRTFTFSLKRSTYCKVISLQLIKINEKK